MARQKPHLNTYMSAASQQDLREYAQRCKRSISEIVETAVRGHLQRQTAETEAARALPELRAALSEQLAIYTQITERRVAGMVQRQMRIDEATLVQATIATRLLAAALGQGQAQGERAGVLQAELAATLTALRAILGERADRDSLVMLTRAVLGLDVPPTQS